MGYRLRQVTVSGSRLPTVGVSRDQDAVAALWRAGKASPGGLHGSFSKTGDVRALAGIPNRSACLLVREPEFGQQARLQEEF